MTLVSNCFGETQTSEINLSKLQKLSLDDKILYSTVKIKQFYLSMNKKVYVSFSGGKDSTVLLHLVRSIYPDIPALYIDTGLEFPEIREFVKTVDNVVWKKPQKSFIKLIEERGYPLVSKSISHWVDLAKRGCPSGIKQMSLDTRFGGKKYECKSLWYVYTDGDSDFDNALKRCEILRSLGVMPYPMFNRHAKRTQRLTNLKRWCRPWIFFKVDWSEYQQNNTRQKGTGIGTTPLVQNSGISIGGLPLD